MRAPDRRRPGRGQRLHGLLALGGDRGEAIGRAVRGGAQIHPPRPAVRARLPRRGRAARSPSRQPVHLRHAAVELGAHVRVGGLGVRLLQAQPQAGERRAQLVGGIGDEVALARERSRPTRSVMSLNVRASERCSALPSTPRARTGRRRRRAPRPPQAVQRAGDLRRDHHPRGQPSSSTTPPMSTRPRIVRRTARLTEANVLGDPHRAPPTTPGLRRSARRWRAARCSACRCGG